MQDPRNELERQVMRCENDQMSFVHEIVWESPTGPTITPCNRIRADEDWIVAHPHFGYAGAESTPDEMTTSIQRSTVYEIRHIPEEHYTPPDGRDGLEQPAQAVRDDQAFR